MRHPLLRSGIHLGMEQPDPCKVVSADITRLGAILTFTDGRTALFTSESLYAMLPEAEKLTHQLVRSIEEPNVP